jgi:Protein of unknown function (DUF642)/PEP-CTERM motif
MRRGICAIFSVLVLVAGMGRVQAGNILVNGGFEDEPNYGSGVINAPGISALTGSQIPGWTIEPGHAVSIHNDTVFPTISGIYSVNTDGEGYNGHNGDFYQDFATTSGASYTLSFDWEGWQDNTSARLEISVEDTVTSSVLFNGLYSWDGFLTLHHVTTSFLGTGDALRLRIQELPESGFNDNTFIVDNFSVVGASVPEPSSMTLLGIAALFALSRAKAGRRS